MNTVSLVRFLAFHEALEKDAQKGAILEELAGRASKGGWLSKLLGKFRGAKPLKVSPEQWYKPLLSPEDYAAGRTRFDPSIEPVVRNGQLLPGSFQPKPLRPVPQLSPSYEGKTRTTSAFRPQAPVDPLGQTAYQPPPSGQVNQFGQTIVRPQEATAVTGNPDFSEPREAGILPPEPSYNQIPVTPPIPGTMAHSQAMWAASGPALRTGVLRRSMNNILGPTGLPANFIPPPPDLLGGLTNTFTAKLSALQRLAFQEFLSCRLAS